MHNRNVYNTSEYKVRTRTTIRSLAISALPWFAWTVLIMAFMELISR